LQRDGRGDEIPRYIMIVQPFVCKYHIYDLVEAGCMVALGR
jgi:hypothetical protein